MSNDKKPEVDIISQDGAWHLTAECLDGPWSPSPVVHITGLHWLVTVTSADGLNHTGAEIAVFHEPRWGVDQDDMARIMQTADDLIDQLETGYVPGHELS